MARNISSKTILAAVSLVFIHSPCLSSKSLRVIGSGKKKDGSDDKLLIKLQNLGVSGTVLKWIHNFLSSECRKLLLEVAIHSIAPRVFLREVFSVLFYSTSIRA